MKKKLPLILAVLAAAAMIFGYIAVNGLSENIEHSGRLFTPKEGELVESIEIKNAYGDFHFRMEEGSWLVSDGVKEYHTNKDKMNLLTSSLLNFKVLRVLDGSEQSYGLEQPQAAVSFKTTGGRARTILVGAKCANVSENYVRADGVDGTIISDAASVAQLTGSLSAYRSNEVFYVDIATVRSIEYYRDGEELVRCESDGENWSISRPFSSGARKLEINEFLSGLWSWSIADYADGKDPSELGLDAPAETLVLTDAGGVRQCIELGKVNGTARYARIGAKDEVVALYNTDLDLSVLTPEALIYEAPLMVPVGETRELSVSFGEKTYNFCYDSEAETAQLNGRYIDYQDLVGVYYRFVLLLADGWDGETPPGESVAELSVTGKDGELHKLSLPQRDDESYFMDFGENRQFIMKASRLTDLMERIEALG